MPLLEIRDLVVRYGEIEALRSISLGVDEGQVVTLLGANGAGKSTTLRAISGLAKPAAGDILFDGKSIAGLGPEAIVRMGISHVPEGRRVFPGLTVKENIMRNAHPHDRFRSKSCDRLSVEQDVAGRGFRETGDRTQGGRLAGAVGAEQGHHLPCVNAKRNAAQRFDFAVADNEIADFEQRHLFSPEIGGDDIGVTQHRHRFAVRNTASEIERVTCCAASGASRDR